MVLVFYCLHPVSHSGLPQDESHVQNYSTPVQNTSLLRTNHTFKIIPHQFKTQVFSGRITRSKLFHTSSKHVFSGRITRSKLFHTSSKHKSSQDESHVQNYSTPVQNTSLLRTNHTFKIIPHQFKTQVFSGRITRSE